MEGYLFYFEIIIIIIKDSLFVQLIITHAFENKGKNI